VGRVKRAFACENTFRHQLQFYFCSTTWATHDQYHHCICFCSSHTDSIKGTYILSAFSFLEALFMLNGRGHRHGQRLSVKLLLSELSSPLPAEVSSEPSIISGHIRISTSGCPLLLQEENKPFRNRSYCILSKPIPLHELLFFATGSNDFFFTLKRQRYL
jgi:hypothetical protein